MRLHYYIAISFLALISCTQNDTEYSEEPDTKPPVKNDPSYLKYFEKGEVYADWETGDWHSGFESENGAVGSFSIRGVENSSTVLWNPEPKEGFDARIHSLEVVELDGSKVLKVWSDGTNFADKGNWDNNNPYSSRAEISWHKFIPQQVGEESYVTYEYKPGDSWDVNTKKYPTIITQFKEYSSGPYFEIMLSNAGLNANNKLGLYVKGGTPDGWDKKTFEKQEIAELDPDSWTTVKIYIKASTGNDGVIKVWLNGGDNGTPTFAYEGRTLLKGNGSYAKFGHYTQIYNSKVSYFDNLHIAKTIDTSLEDWAKASAELE